MAVTLKGRDLLSLHDFTTEEIHQILETAAHLKLRQKAGLRDQPLAGKTLAMIFHKPSTRTRVSFEVGMLQLGGFVLHLRADELQLRRGETVADTARVLSQYVDGIMIRTYSHADVVELAEYAAIPVINGLTDLLHPCQVLADLLTMQEKTGRLAGLRVTYLGDGNNVAHSLMFGAAKVGINLTLAVPSGYEPDPDVLAQARRDAVATGAGIQVGGDPREAVRDADVVYTDVWASMGQEEEREERKRAFAPFQVTQGLMAEAAPRAIFMHDLPAHRGEEVVDEVMDGPQSAVFHQAQNRLHAQKAALALLL